MKDFDQETWIPTDEQIRKAVISAYGRLSEEWRIQMIMYWTEVACLAFPKDRNAAKRYLLWLLENAEEGEYV